MRAAMWFLLRVFASLVIVCLVGYIDVTLSDDRNELFEWFVFKVHGVSYAPTWEGATTIVMLIVLPYSVLSILVYAALTRLLHRARRAPAMPVIVKGDCPAAAPVEPEAGSRGQSLAR